MTVDDLARVVAELTERVARLELSATRPAARVPDAITAPRLLADLQEAGAEHGTVVYAGLGPWGDGAVVWQMGRDWAEVRSLAGAGVAQLFAALGNPLRVRIVSELLGGGRTTGELVDRLEQPSAGQLFHHLKELLGAGVIHQPVRGTYAVRPQHVIPLLGVLTAAVDVATAADRSEPT